MSTKEELKPLVYQEAAQQPDMGEVERLVTEFRADAMGYAQCRTAEARTALDTAKAALLDYVRGILAERDALIHDNERLMQIAAQAMSKCVPVSEVKDAAPELVKGGLYNWKHQKERLIYLGRSRSGNVFWHQFAKVETPAGVWCEVLDSDLHMFEKTPQPISTAEVPMPDSDYRLLTPDSTETVWNREQMQQYGDAREAAGYARGMVEADKICRLYNELLYQVETKHPGETRHETALVYIRMAEKYLRNQNAQEVK